MALTALTALTAQATQATQATQAALSAQADRLPAASDDFRAACEAVLKELRANAAHRQAAYSQMRANAATIRETLEGIQK